jgi:hypothetical protein
MKTLASLVGWTLLMLLGRILGSLVVDQIKAWFPGMRRGIVRRQARRMGPESSRFEEEWLADIEATPGDLAKLWVVLPLLFVPLRTALERWRDSPERLKNLVARLALDHGWVIVVGFFIWTCVHYPPDSGRSAAYRVLLPLVGCTALALSGRLRAALKSLYEDRLNYSARVGVGGSVVPLLIYIIVSWSVVPPEGPARTTRAFASQARPTVLFVPPSALSMDNRVDSPKHAMTDPRPVRDVPRRRAATPKMAAARKDEGYPGVQQATLALAVAQAFRAPAISVEPSGRLQIPGFLLSQPIPPFPVPPVHPPPAPPSIVSVR